MNALFLATSNAGFGETLIGLALARRILPTTRVHFIVHPMSAPLCDDNKVSYRALSDALGPESVVEAILREVDLFRPDVIVLADYFIHTVVFPSTYRVDPWFIEELGVPVVPIDIWEWRRSQFEVDVFGGSVLRVDDRFLRYPASLRPVPFCHPSDDSDPSSFPFCLYPDGVHIPSQRRSEVRRSLGMKIDERLVVTSLARWQVPRFGNPDGDRIAREVPHLLARYLDAVEQPLYVVNVGQHSPGLTAVSNHRTHQVPPLSPNQFNDLVAAADMFLSLNLGATSVTRATAANVPCVVFTNSHALSHHDEVSSFLASLPAGDDRLVGAWLRDNAPIYPFRMWPTGFHRFMDPVVRDNPYIDTLHTAELLEPTAALCAIHRAITSNERASPVGVSRCHYLRDMSTLSTPEKAFEELLAYTGIRPRAN